MHRKSIIVMMNHRHEGLAGIRDQTIDGIRPAGFRNLTIDGTRPAGVSDRTIDSHVVYIYILLCTG